MKQWLKYILAGALGFGACFALISLGMSQAFEVPYGDKTFTCFRSN